jgi:hypothetical protein
MKKAFFILLSALCICAVNRATAQVTIGSTAEPQSFSILELVSNNTSGLRLPQMTTANRNALGLETLTDTESRKKAEGLQIFNTTTRCVETWNGTKWIEQCNDINVSNQQTLCGGATVNDLIAAGANIKWYNVETGGEALAGSTILVTGKYYVSQTVNGIESERIEITVTIKTTPAPQANSQSFCPNDNLTVVSLVATGTDIKWYSEPSGGEALKPDAGIGTKTYYVTQTLNGCESDRKDVVVTVNNDCVTMPAGPMCPGMTIPPVRFAKYNLGANPYYNDPKAQIQYLATVNVASAIEDANVLGGLYQWGRKDLTHGASTNGTYLRYRTAETATIGYVTSISDAQNGIYYYGYENWYYGSYPEPDKLWGNGVAINTPTSGGGVYYSGNYYQKPVKTSYDPCPTGFRVPTQDELERICNYDCKPNSVTNTPINFSTNNINGTVPPNNPYLTWVPVRAGKADNTGWDHSHDPKKTGGYAIYDTNEWSKARAKGGYFDPDGDGVLDMTKPLYVAQAPNPLLFLPATGSRAANDPLIAGGFGQYWCSTICGENLSHTLVFRDTNVYLGETYYMRTNGRSIRCVLE